MKKRQYTALAALLPLLIADPAPAQAATLAGTTWTLTGTLNPAATLFTTLKAPAYNTPQATRLPAQPVASSTPAIKAQITFNPDNTFTYYDIDASASAAANAPVISPVNSSTSGNVTSYTRSGNVNVTNPYTTASTWTPAVGVTKGKSSSALTPTTASASIASWSQTLANDTVTAANNTTSVNNPAWSFFYWTAYTGTWVEKGHQVSLTLDADSTNRLYYTFNGNTSNTPGASNYANPAFDRQRYVFKGQTRTTRGGTEQLTLNQGVYLGISKAFQSGAEAIPKGKWSISYRYVKKLRSQ